MDPISVAIPGQLTLREADRVHDRMREAAFPANPALVGSAGSAAGTVGTAGATEQASPTFPIDPGADEHPAGTPTLPGALPGSAFSPDALPDGLVVADSRGTVTVFNRAASRLTGTRRAAAVGADVRDVLPLRDRDGRCWWTLARPYGGLRIRTRQVELPLYLPDGTELLVTVSCTRAPRRGGPVRTLVFCLRPADPLARTERSRADLVSTVAHELRSPLTSVKGFTATMLDKWQRFTDDQKRVMLETVNADADRVTRLITELLDVSRIESGRLEVRRQVVDLPEQVRKVIAGRVAAGDGEDRFRLEVRGRLPETWADPDKVDQILGNLLENAVRHGAGTVTVVVQPSDPAQPGATQPGTVVSVRDQGPGISPEMAPRVFRQFWRAKRRGGTGLGLFIVKGLVEAHGGSIAVQRAPGGGAEFRFTLPAGTPDFA